MHKILVSIVEIQPMEVLQTSTTTAVSMSLTIIFQFQTAENNGYSKI